MLPCRCVSNAKSTFVTLCRAASLVFPKCNIFALVDLRSLPSNTLEQATLILLTCKLWRLLRQALALSETWMLAKRRSCPRPFATVCVSFFNFWAVFSQCSAVTSRYRQIFCAMEVQTAKVRQIKHVLNVSVELTSIECLSGVFVYVCSFS